MRVLALETSGRLGSIALLEAANGIATLLEERELPAGERSARSLLPSVHQLLTDHGWRPREINLVAVTNGPGSFTGLRIGVVAAKTISYATRATLVGVHTLAAMAEQVTASGAAGGRYVWTVLDAQRQELFAARFAVDADLAADAAPPTEILGVEAWLARLEPGDVVAGPPLTKLGERLPSGVIAVADKLWPPSAAATGRLGVQLAARGATVAPLALVPNYYRRSAAEEKAAAGS